MDYKRIYKDIMNSDPKIRLVTICDSITQLAPKIGKGKYVLVEYEKLKRITMPLGDEQHLLYITTEPEADHSKIIETVRTLSL
jgi:hypothetical protein